MSAPVLYAVHFKYDYLWLWVQQVDPALKLLEIERKKKKKIIPGADYLESIPHAPWPSRYCIERHLLPKIYFLPTLHSCDRNCGFHMN